MFAQNISKEDINLLPLGKFEGDIVIIDQISQLATAFEAINQHAFVGFDTETKPVFVRGESNKVSLLQIAIPGQVFLT